MFPFEEVGGGCGGDSSCVFVSLEVFRILPSLKKQITKQRISQSKKPLAFSAYPLLLSPTPLPFLLLYPPPLSLHLLQPLL